MNKTPFRAGHLVQWNARHSKDNAPDLVDPVVEAVMHDQGIPFEHTNEYRSNYSYQKLWEQLEHFDHNKVLNGRDPYLRYGLEQAFRIFSCPCAESKLKPVNLMHAAGELITLLGIRDTSAGLTAYGDSKLEAFTIGLDKAIDILLGKRKAAPCLAGVRTQRKEKTRLVWMYPLEMTIIEAIFMRPLINHWKTEEGVMTFGQYSHETGLRIRKAISRNQMRVSWDASQFDSSVNTIFIKSYFKAVRTWFDLKEEVYPGITLDRVIDVAESYMINCGIVMPNQNGKYPILVTGIVGGTKSGSYNTASENTYTSVAMGFAASKKFSLGLTADDVFSLGDDLMIFIKRWMSRQDAADFLVRLAEFMNVYGIKMNAAKSSIGYATEDADFLGRRWHNGFPIREWTEITRGALYPENYRKYSTNRALRQKEALSVLSSYLLTSYVEDPPTDLKRLNQVYFVSPNIMSGFSAYLLKEGLIPGDVLTRAIY